ncbi:MAG: STAS domain-containing protein [Oceanobacter sp.]
MFDLIDKGQARLSGDLNMDTVPDLLQPGRDAILAAGNVFKLDLSSVDAVSSAAVALLIDWIRVAGNSDVKLEVSGLPAQMRSIIQVSDLESLFEGSIDSL